MNIFWIFARFTWFLSGAAFFAYPLSVYLGKGTKDPDIYEFFGWFGSFALLLFAILCGLITLSLWLFQRNQKQKIVEELRL